MRAHVVYACPAVQFEKCGFDVVGHQTDGSFMTTLYLLRQRVAHEIDHAFVDINDVENFTWIEPLKKTIEERISKPDTHTIWLLDNEVRASFAKGRKVRSTLHNVALQLRDNGTVGLALCLREEHGKFNRMRSIVDVSLKPENRSGPAVCTKEHPDFKWIVRHNLHANNYRDGDWGSFRHMVIKEGAACFTKARSASA